MQFMEDYFHPIYVRQIKVIFSHFFVLLLLGFYSIDVL